jgi:hypothetical protein
MTNGELQKLLSDGEGLTELYSGEEPELIEGDVFRTIVSLGTSPVESNGKNQTGDEIVEGVKTAQKTGGTVQKSPVTPQKTTESVQKTTLILAKIRQSPKISGTQLMM